MVAGAAQLRVLTMTLAATAEAAHNLARVLSNHAGKPPRSPLALDSPLSPVRALLREHAAAAHWTALALDAVLAASHSHTASPPPLAGTLHAAPPPVPNARVPTAVAPHAETIELDLCALLCTLVDATALVGERHQTRVHFVCAEPFCTVRADPSQLARTLLLALGLVLDAADPGGFLALELHIDADGARLGIEVLPTHAYPHLDHLSPEAAWDTLVGSIARLGCPVSVAPPASRTAAELASHAVSAEEGPAHARVPLLGIELTLPVSVVTKAHPPRVGGTGNGTMSTAASSSRGASFPLGATSLLHSTLPWPLGGALAAHAGAHAGASEDAASLSFWRFCLQLLLGAQTPSGLAPPLAVGLVAGAGIDSELGEEPFPISPAVDGAVQRRNSFHGVTPRVWSPAWGTFPFQNLANLAYGTNAAGVAAVDKLPPLVVVSNVQVDDMAVMLAALQAQLQGDAKPVTTGPAEDHADPVSKAPSVGVLVHVPDQHGVHAVLRALHNMAWCPSTIAVQIASGCVPVPSLVAHLHDLYQRTRAGMLALRQYAPGYATPAIARDPAWPAEPPGVALPLTPVTPNGYASAWTTTPPRSAVRNDDASGGGHGQMTSGTSAHAPETPISPTSPADWTAPVARPPNYTRARLSFRGTAASPSRAPSPRAETPPMHPHLLSPTSPARPGASPVSSGTAPVLVEPPPRLSRAFTMQDPTWIRRRIDFQAGFPGAPGALAAVGQTPSAQQSGASTPTETSGSPPIPAPVRPPGLRRTASRKAVPPPLDIAATMSSRLARQEVESARLAAMSAEHAFHPSPSSSSSSSTRATGNKSNDVPTMSADSAAALAALPPPPRPAKAYSSPDHRARGGGRVIPPIRVLLVEDNPINLRILTAFLSQRGIRYAAARDGAEAVNVFAAAPPGSGTEFHLVLMDVQLPVMDGLEATRRIRGVEAKWDGDRRAAARRKCHHQSPSPGPTATQGGRRARAAGPSPQPPPARPGGAAALPGSASTVATAGMTARRRAISQPEVAVAAKAAGMRGKQQRSPPTSTPTSPTKKMSPPVSGLKSRSPGAVGISTRVRVRTGGAAARFTAPPGSRSLTDLVRAHADRISAAAAAAKCDDVDDQSDARPAASGAVPTTAPVPAGCNSIVVALTASSTPDDRKAALQAGCNDFISKPLNLKWLESKIIEWGSIQSIIKFSQ
ncbi:hypothetical protein GGF31_000377 [Allomyces arbusculus]|nr:hypothetical protein GGF31_000377 [Allomyces arbusculus]